MGHRAEMAAAVLEQAITYPVVQSAAFLAGREKARFLGGASLRRR